MGTAPAIQPAMWRVIACAAVWTLSGCGSEDCGELHQVMVGSSGTAPGTLLSGIRYETSASTFAVRSDGSLVCPTCSGLLMLDPELHMIGRAGPPRIDRLVIAPDDAMYGLTIEPIAGNSQLFALSPAGQVLWKSPFAWAAAFVDLAAGAEGAYAMELVQASGGSGVSGVVERFDAMTGERHTLATNQLLLGVANGGGVFTFDSSSFESATLHSLDMAGNPVWSRTLTAGSIRLLGAVATPDGGVVLFGVSDGDVDFGDRTLAFEGQGSFVAGFDGAGVTQWAFSAPYHVTSLAVNGDEILLTTLDNEADATFAVATPAGISHTLNFTGPGLQEAAGLAVTPDGLVWLQIRNSQDPNTGVPPVMHAGDLTFPDPGTYLFKLVP